MFMYVGEERAARPAEWSIISILKKLFGLLILMSILKMLCFPAATPPSDEEMLQQAHKRFKLDDTEILSINKMNTMEEKKEAYK